MATIADGGCRVREQLKSHSREEQAEDERRQRSGRERERAREKGS